MKTVNHDLIALALRHFAEVMANNPTAYSKEEGQQLDRALRSCPGIIDIDRVWVRWRYVGEPMGWMTDKEMVIKNDFYMYPKAKSLEPVELREKPPAGYVWDVTDRDNPVLIKKSKFLPPDNKG
jgi:hypothetical protein